MNNASLEEKIKLLENRVNYLEKMESKRKRNKLIKIILKLISYIIILILIYTGYNYLKVNYLDPYDNFKKEVNENINNIKNYDYNSIINGLLGK